MESNLSPNYDASDDVNINESLANINSQASTDMKPTLEQIIPLLQEKVSKNSLRLDDMESMMNKLDPFLARQMAEALQFLRQNSTSNANVLNLFNELKTDSNLNEHFQTSTLMPLKVNTNVSSNHPYLSPTNSSLNSPPAQCSNTTHNDEMSPPQLNTSSSDPYWSTRVESDGVRRRVDDGAATSFRGVSAAEGKAREHNDLLPNVFNLHPSSQRGSTCDESNNPPTSSNNFLANISIKEEPNASFEELEEQAVSGGQLVTISGRNRGLGKANEPKFVCQICGDVAAGFHCGAYVCEACKKFYLRCLKSGGAVAYSCPKNKDCPISKETRSHCQFCRYKKCIDLGMYKPGRDDSRHLRVDFKSIPCKVCAAPSSGFHFGAITCEGCKGFFRRMVKEKLHKKFVCMSGGKCDVASSNRTSCKACRYYKCIAIGMALQGTRLGRQSNSVKRSTLIEYQKRHGMSVALFPKLGDDETGDAVAKVEQLLLSKAPEIQIKMEACESSGSSSMLSPGTLGEDASLQQSLGMRSGQCLDGEGRLDMVHISEEQLQSEIEADCAQQATDDDERRHVTYTAELLQTQQAALHSSNVHITDLSPNTAMNRGTTNQAVNGDTLEAQKSAALDLRQDTTLQKLPDDGWLSLLSTSSSEHPVSAASALSLSAEQNVALLSAELLKRSKSCDASNGVALQQQQQQGLASPINIFPQTDSRNLLSKQSKQQQDPFINLPVSFHHLPPMPKASVHDMGATGNKLFRDYLPLASPPPITTPIATVAPMPYLSTPSTIHNTHVSHAQLIQAYGGTLPPLATTSTGGVTMHQADASTLMGSPQSQLSPPMMASPPLNINDARRRHMSAGSTDFKNVQLANDFELAHTVSYQPETGVVSAAERKRRSASASVYMSPKPIKRKCSEDNYSTEISIPETPKPSPMKAPVVEFDWQTLNNTPFMRDRVMEAYKELENLSHPRAALDQGKVYTTEKEKAWYAAYESFMHHAKYTLRFVKKIPGFKQLVIEDQVTLVREAVYPITLLFHSQFYNPDASLQRWFCNTDDERAQIWTFFPKFKDLHSHIEHSGFLFRELKVTRDEYAFLCSMMVFSVDADLVKDSAKITRILDALTQSMQDHFTDVGRDAHRAATLIQRLSELKRANYEHTQIAMEVQRQNPDLDFSQLWHEMFLSK